MSSLYFVAGTDTGVGKTSASLALLAAGRQLGLDTAAVKPVASGCRSTPRGWRNEDALALQAVMTRRLDYDTVNPVALPRPLSPHLAAAAAGRTLQVRQLLADCHRALTPAPDLGLVEGAGGWRVPISPAETLADLARALACPVVLVVGLRLGCISHALLTAEAIEADGLQLAGWVGNHCDADAPCQHGVLTTLHQRLAAPCLGILPHLAPGPLRHWAAQLARHLDIGLLLRRH